MQKRNLKIVHIDNPEDDDPNEEDYFYLYSKIEYGYQFVDKDFIQILENKYAFSKNMDNYKLIKMVRDENNKWVEESFKIKIESN
jgi:hypothetical protein